ncbi:MAG TPA: superoxide dismutase family protein [Pseudonocardiaceae bacterium]|jgi:Cu-Zn family superoxide dismutase
MWRVATAVLSLAVTGLAIVALSSPAGAAEPMARATLLDANGVEIGKVMFKGTGKYAERIRVELVAPNAPNLGAFHALHVHTTGVCDPAPSGTTLVPFGSAGGHWNPTGAAHGNHVGDLPSVLLTPNGEVYAEFETARVDVAAMLAGDGSAVVLHAGPDNFANVPSRYIGAPADPLATGVPGPDAATLATGDAGGRYACGVLEPIR